MKIAVSGLNAVNSDKDTDKTMAERCITFVTHIIAFCSIFLLLMLFSHTILANEQQIEKTNIDHQVLVAVFEDHNEQVEASMGYGLSWRLMELAAEQQNLDLVKISTTWQSSINRLKDNRLDLMFGAFKTDAREKWATFTLPLVSEASVLASSIDSPVNDIKDVDFENEVVGVVSNSTQETLAREIGFKHIYPARVRKRLLKILESGRIDYVLLGNSAILLYCQNVDPCVQQVGETLDDNYLRVMALKNSPRSRDLIKALNAGLAEIYNNREILDLFLSHGYSESYYQKWKTQFENELMSASNTVYLAR